MKSSAKICMGPGCRQEVRTAGYCPRHYQQIRRHGRLTPEREYQSRGASCTAGQCDKPQVAKGLCFRHYQQVRRYGRLTPERERSYGRTNCRIQIFDTDGQFLQELTGFGEPNAVYFDPREEVVYLAERLHQVSTLTLDGDVITQWGGGAKSEKPGEFIATPHGIWADSRGDLYVAEAETENRLQKFARIR